MSKKIIKLLLVLVIISSFMTVSNVYAHRECMPDPVAGDLICESGPAPGVVMKPSECAGSNAVYNTRCATQIAHVKDKQEEEDAKALENYVTYITTGTDDDFVFDCSNNRVRQALKVIYNAINILRIIAPIIIVMVGVFQFAKAAMSQDDNDLRALSYDLFKKVAIGAIIFIVPAVIMSVLRSLTNNVKSTDSSWYICIQEIFEKGR